MGNVIVDNESTCKFLLVKVKISDNTPHEWGLFIYLKDDTFQESRGLIFAATRSVHEGLLRFSAPHRILESPFISSATNALGEVTNTRFYFYGHGKRSSLLVYEGKRKRRGEDPYTGTVVHYYINTENGQDIGLSVALKRIKLVLSGNVWRFDYAVDGPEQHPVAALLYMFEEVRRTKTWKPNSCPHCANNITQRAGIWHSETEDSDIDTVPALVSGRWQNG